MQLYTDFVPLKSIDLDTREALAEENGIKELDLIGESTMPKYVAVTPDGKVIGAVSFDPSLAVFVKFLQESLRNYPKNPG